MLFRVAGGHVSQSVLENVSVWSHAPAQCNLNAAWQGGIRLVGDARTFSSLAEFYKAFAMAGGPFESGLVPCQNLALLQMRSPLVGRSDHLHAPWFQPSTLSKEQMHVLLRTQPSGSFRVFTKDGQCMLAYVCGDDVLFEAVELTGDSARLRREEVMYFSLSALVAAHFCDAGVLQCVLRPAASHLLLRSPYLNAAGRTVVTAHARVDAEARAAEYYLGGVPEEVALSLLEGAFDGAYVVRDSLFDSNLLWLHYVDNGIVKHVRIENTSSGLCFAASPQKYPNLTQLLDEYVANPRNDLGIVLLHGWNAAQPRAPPLIGPYDHLTAPWFVENASREDANKLLDYRPPGTFVCVAIRSRCRIVHICRRCCHNVVHLTHSHVLQIVRSRYADPSSFALDYVCDGMIVHKQLFATESGYCVEGSSLGFFRYHC